MDYSKLKGRSSYPFQTLAVAVAFSPRLEAVLAEAARLADTFTAQLLLIHVGKRTSGKEAVLQEICGRLGIDRESRMIWQSGEPISCLLRICKDNLVDLLVLGALRRENVLRYYLGSVARGMSRRAKCSLLLLIEPKVSGSSFQEIVVSCVAHPKTLPTLNTAVYFAKQVGSRKIHVVREVDQSGLAMAMSDDSPEGESTQVKDQLFGQEVMALQNLIDSCNPGEIPVNSKVIAGRPGFAIRQYTENSGADLLVINSPDGRYGIIDRIFTHDMEHILERMPCNMLIVHSRIPD
ncbi:MAG: universal stress protein [Desulfoprunum sp.]|nr:universal stress protein [Desulfoprunum sp.]